MKIKGFFNSAINNEKVKALENRFMYFFKNFWPSIVVIMITFFGILISNSYKSRFRVNEITKFIKDSKYVGNAVFINKKFIITNAIPIDNLCKITKEGQTLKTFIVYDGQVFRVDVIDRDYKLDLALLKINKSEDNYINVNNFVILPNVSDDRYNYINTYGFISKTYNDPEKIKYKAHKITSISDVGYATKSYDILRNNNGEAVLNDRLEFIGLTAGNTGKSIKNIFSNKIKIIDDGKIKNFLKKNSVYYYKNYKNVDLRDVANYKNSINAKVICYVQEPLPRRVIKIHK